MTGQFLPNRNVATNDQLEQKMAPLTAAIATQTIEIASMRDQLNDLKGQLKAQHLLSVQ